MKKAASNVILVVEDDPDDAELFRFVSRNSPEPLAIHFVDDGEEAISYLKGEGRFGDRKAHPLPHLLLLDVKLPKLDGFAVLDWVRASSAFKDLEVFIWTGWENPELGVRAQEAGARHFVKPVQLESLAAMFGNMSVALRSANEASRSRAEGRSEP